MILTEEFYSSLEAYLSSAFANAQDKHIRGYFCDGILDPEWAEDYLPMHVKHTQQIIARAWIDQGNNSQIIYQLVLKLGSESCNAYVEGRDLKAFFPIAEDSSWVTILPEKRRIELRLV